jgi:5-methylcytosine-specific restriction endonuclease McrA
MALIEMSEGNSKSMRKRTRSHKYMPQLMCDFNGRCAYCDELVVPERMVVPVRKSAHWISYIDGRDQLVRRRRATIDHVVAIRDGGTNRYDNLKLSCATCNQNRTAQPKATQNLTCRKCGTTSKPKRMRYCRSCSRLMLEEFQLLFLGRS